MHWLAILLLIILVLIAAILIYQTIRRRLFTSQMSGVNLAKIQLTAEAMQRFNQFVAEHPDIANYEAREVGLVSLLSDPPGYFATEFVEPEHETTAKLTMDNSWLINEAIMRLWIQEEIRAFAYKKRI